MRFSRILELSTAVAVAMGCAVLAAPAVSAGTCPTLSGSYPYTLTPGPYAGVDWSGCDLRGADLTLAVLNWAQLSGANLSTAVLERTELVGANLSGADLTGASLRLANADRANLVGANLTSVQSRSLRLGNADLTGANLSRASLPDAHLQRTNMSGVNLTGANLTDVNFYEDTVLSGAFVDCGTGGTFDMPPSVSTPSTLPGGWSLVGTTLSIPVVPCAGPPLPSWSQSYGRPMPESPCLADWSPSWALWAVPVTGGWVCDRTVPAVG